MRKAGLVLAGGEGRRWGGPKAWARLPDGRSFLEACTETLSAGGASPVVATLPPGGGPVPEGVTPVVLPESGLDMMASVRQGLLALLERPEWDRVVILPVDHPLVRPSTVAALAAVRAPAVMPRFRGRHGHPLCVSRQTADRLAGGGFEGPTLREVLREAEAVDLEVDDPAVRVNCNTPEALAAAVAELGGLAP